MDSSLSEHRPKFVSSADAHALEAEGYSIVDGIEEAIEDLFKLDFPYIQTGNPEYGKTYKGYLKAFGYLESYGRWAVFPWKRTIVHLPPEEDYFKLRTARNKFLITEDEQERFYGAKIGVAGLSVGSSALNAIVLSGGGKHLRIADPDTLAIVNLNRLFSSVCDVGTNKAIAASRRAYEINPFQEIELFTDGVTSENIGTFFGEGDDGLDLFIEEMDNIKLKIVTRFKARELGIPVVMATDNGDNAIIDVERFDLEPDRPLFHNRVDEKILSTVPEHPTGADKVRLASAIVGSDITPRTMTSLTLVGSKIPSWPQLGNAANLSGVAVSYLARRIVTGEEVPSGRYEVNLDSLLDPAYNEPGSVAARKKHKDEFIKGFELLFGG